MTLQEELQINIVMSNYNQRSGSYSSGYDYLFLDNLSDSPYADLFRNDLKNLKIKTKDKINNIMRVFNKLIIYQKPLEITIQI
jgi:hypothetical protein